METLKLLQKWWLLIAVLFIMPSINAQVCTEDILLTTQAEVDAFNCTTVMGNLKIEGADITDLSPLSGLTYVSGNLDINNNTSLTNVDGLSSLDSVGGRVYILYENAITNVDGLSSLKTVGGALAFYQQTALTNIDGLSSLTYAGGLGVDYTTALTNVDGLSSLVSVGGRVEIYGNTALTNLDGLSSLTMVDGDFVINFNSVLQNVDGLSSLTSVGLDFEFAVNDVLMNVDGLSSLTTIGGYLNFYLCPLLTQVDSLSSLTSIGTYLYFYYLSALSNVDGISSLSTVGGLYCGYTDALTNVDGFSSITTIGEHLYLEHNSALTNLDGLSSVTTVGGMLYLDNNSELTRFCGLYPLLSGGGLVGSYVVTNNGYDPTQQMIIDNGPCSTCVDRTVFFKDSNGDMLAGGFLEYQDGGWHTAEETSTGVFYIDSEKDFVKLRMTWCESEIIVTVPTISCYTFKTVEVSFELRKRNGELGYNHGQVYYVGYGGELGRTGDDGLGVLKKELLPRAYDFRLKFRGGTGIVSQDITVDPVVTWQMARMLVQLNKSDGTRGLNGADIKYKGHSQEHFGVTGEHENGRARKDLLPGTYKFTIKYLGGKYIEEDFEVIAGDNQLIIDGVAVTCELLESGTDAPVDGGKAENLNTGSNIMGYTGDSGSGIVTIDLLPLVYNFEMTYDGDKDTQYDVDVTETPWITFYTDDLKFSHVNNKKTGKLVAYPIPFGNSTTIDFELEKGEEVLLTIYDVRGNLVETLQSGYMPKGNHKIVWEPSNLETGIYIVRLKTDTQIAHQNLVKQ